MLVESDTISIVDKYEQHAQLAMKAAELGFRVVRTEGMTQSLLLVEGEDALPNENYDINKFMLFATLISERAGVYSVKESHTFLTPHIWLEPYRSANLAYRLWMQNVNMFYETTGMSLIDPVHYDEQVVKFNRLNSIIDTFLEEAKSFAGPFTGSDFKSKMLPFIIAGFTSKIAVTAWKHKLVANSLTALSLHCGFITHDELILDDDIPHEWLEEVVLPDNINDLLSTIYNKN